MGGVLRCEFFGYTNLGTGGSGKVAMSERIQEAAGEPIQWKSPFAVLKQVEAQYLQNPKDYERPPFLRTSARLQAIIL